MTNFYFTLTGKAIAIRCEMFIDDQCGMDSEMQQGWE